MRTKEAESSVQPSAVNQVQPAVPTSTTWAKLPDQTTFVVLNVIGLTLAIMCLTIQFAALYIEILAEFDRRARADSGEAVSTLEIIGTEHQATAIVSFAESAGARRATIRLRYPDHLPAE